MARSFNGSSQQFYAASAAATGPPLAMSCWFNADPTISQDGTLVSLTEPDPGGQRFELQVQRSSSKIRAVSRDSVGFGIATSATTFSTGAWQHAFAVWYTSADRRVWLNGGGQGTNATSSVPSGIAQTCLGASRIGTPFAQFKGFLAEAAIWAGSGVENMGAAEAAILAKSCSPRCLGRWLGNLVLYQDLIRPVNRPGTGPTMTEVGSPPSAAHPRMIYPRSHGLHLGRFFDPYAFNPYRADAAMVDAGNVMRGFAASDGVELGLTIPIGEVSI
jgi:hypothetical protein